MINKNVFISCKVTNFVTPFFFGNIKVSALILKNKMSFKGIFAWLNSFKV